MTIPGMTPDVVVNVARLVTMFTADDNPASLQTPEARALRAEMLSSPEAADIHLTAAIVFIAATTQIAAKLGGLDRDVLWTDFAAGLLDAVKAIQQPPNTTESD